MGKILVDEDKILRELRQMRDELDFIKNILVDEGDLTDESKNWLKEARSTPEKDYIRLEDL